MKLLLIITLALAALPAFAQNGDPDHPTSLQGLTEAMLIDGQPALRFLSRSGDTAYAKLQKRDGEDALVFKGVRLGGGHIIRPKYGTLYVTAKNVVFDPDEKKSNYLNIPKTDIKEASVATPPVGKVALLLRFRDEKTFFALNYAGLNNHVRPVELWPPTSFIVRAITDFDKALAEFNQLTESARPRVVIEEDDGEDEFTVSDRYDRFRGATVVTTSKMMLRGGKRSIRIFADYGFPGKTPKKPETATLYLYASAGAAVFYDDALGLIFLIDEEPLPLGSMKIVEEEKTSTAVKQTVSIVVPYDTFAKIAGAKKAEFQIGKLEYKLTARHLEAFKNLLSYEVKE